VNGRQATPKSQPRFAFLALLGGNLALALGPLLVRLADTGPIAAGVWRLALAVPLLALLAWRVSPATGNPRLSRGLLLTIGLGGLFFAVDLASWHLGIVRTKLANAALFGNISTLILPLAGILLTGIWPSRVQWSALALALAGAVLLMGASYELAPEHLVGDALCILAGIMYVGYLLAIQQARQTMGSWQVLLVSTLASVPFMLTFSLMAGEQLMPTDWTPVLVLALTSQIIGQGLLVFALPYFTPIVVGLVLLVQPLMSAMLGWLVFREALGALDITGAAIIAVALVLVRLPDGRNKTGAAAVAELREES
jgi:drug/metabolite transporter (DMT)-like permease